MADVVVAALVAEAEVLLALVELAEAEELLSLTELATVVDAMVVLTVAMLVEEALTLLVVTGESHPGPHPDQKNRDVSRRLSKNRPIHYSPKKQKKGSALGTGAALATATNMAARGARAVTRILRIEE